MIYDLDLFATNVFMRRAWHYVCFYYETINAPRYVILPRAFVLLIYDK